MAQKNAVVAHVLCTLHPQIPELVMLKTMNWLRPGRKHKSKGVVNAAEFGPNGSRIFCKEDEPDPPPAPGTIVVDKLAEYHERIRKAAESGDAEAAEDWDMVQRTRKRAVLPTRHS